MPFSVHGIKIPKIIKTNWEKAKTIILSDAEFSAELKKKLHEETIEILEDESMEELADICRLCTRFKSERKNV